jgi:hypothetical protein
MRRSILLPEDRPDAAMPPRPPPPVYVFAIIVVLVLILAVLVARMSCRARTRFEDDLTGVWHGDAVFLEKSKLEDFQVYFAPQVGRAPRDGYLVMTGPAGDIIANRAFTLDCPRAGVMRGLHLACSRKETLSRRASFLFDGADAPPFGEDVQLALVRGEGSLTIYDADKVYAHLYKDHQASAAARAVSDEEDCA